MFFTCSSEQKGRGIAAASGADTAHRFNFKLNSPPVISLHLKVHLCDEYPINLSSRLSYADVARTPAESSKAAEDENISNPILPFL